MPTTPRHNLTEIIAEAGFTFAEGETDGRYWDESAFYRFTLNEIEEDIERPTNELVGLCNELVDRAVVDDELFGLLGLPMQLQDLARDSWKNGDQTVYGRFDLSYDGRGPAKLLEYNADTPTSLFEAAVFQWGWLEDTITARSVPCSSDQFNAIHDCLIEQWKRIAKPVVHFASLRDIEDEITVQYLAHTAQSAGVEVKILFIDEIGDFRGRFVDGVARPIETLFKLYPWEWLVEDDFSRSPSMMATSFLEPAWKAILSTKAILPLLWMMAPGHPNLLPARFSDDVTAVDLGNSFVRKPFRSREGANVMMVENGEVIETTAGAYRGKSVDQALARLPVFDGNRPVIGSWVIGDKACGIGIREGLGDITTNTSRFIPHIICDA